MNFEAAWLGRMRESGIFSVAFRPILIALNALEQVGMRHFHKTKNNLHCPIVNLDKIWSLVGEEVSNPRSTMNLGSNDSMPEDRRVALKSRWL